MRPTLPSGAIALSVALSLCRAAAPCGLAFKAGPGGPALTAGAETTWAVIAHRGGVQRMLLCREAPLDGVERALWIIPVPARAGDVSVTVVDSFPLIWGSDPRWHTGAEVDRYMALIRATQVWPILLDMFYLPISSSRIGGPRPRTLLPHEHASAVGVQAEAVESSTAPSLGAHLRARGVSPPVSALGSLASYWSDGNCVVVVALEPERDSISGPAKAPQGSAREAQGHAAKRGWPCVLIEFPAERPVCPLAPAPAQKGMAPILELFVVGHVALDDAPSEREAPAEPPRRDPRAYGQADPSPERGADWRREVAVRHRVESTRPAGTPEGLAAALPERDIPFTHVYLSPWEAQLPPELTFRPVEPEGMAKAVAVRAFMRSWWAVVAAVSAVAVLSYVAAGLSGVTLHGRWRGLARFGLWNLGTFLTVIAVAHGSGGERRRLLVKPVDSPIFRWGPRFYSRLSVIFVILTVITQLLVHVLLGV